MCDICRDRVFFVPELVGPDVPVIHVKGTLYKDIPNLRLETCPSPPSYKARSNAIEKAPKLGDHESSQADESAEYMQYESLRHL